MIHLSDDDDEAYIWTPKPGNPNILIGAGGKEPEKKKKVVASSSSNVKDVEQFIAPLLYRALQPLYRVVDMIGTESGKTLYYRYSKTLTQEKRKIPIEWDCKTRKEFYAKNQHLGDDILSVLQTEFPVDRGGGGGDDDESDIEFMVIGNPITVQHMATYQTLFGTNTPLSMKMAPQWIWCHIEEPVFQYLLQNAVYGALELAANELEYPLKDLIYSDDVNHLFAQFVARKFVSPKQNAQASGMDGQRGLQYRIHSGFYTDQQDTKWLMGAKITFKNNVHYEDSKIKVRDLDERVRQLQETWEANRAIFMQKLEQYNALGGHQVVFRTHKQFDNDMNGARALYVAIPFEYTALRVAAKADKDSQKSYKLALKVQRCFEPRVLKRVKGNY